MTVNGKEANIYWMNTIRGLAVLAVVVHHWLFFIPFQGSVQGFCVFARLIQDVAGTALNLFFILSGAGLTVSYYTKCESTRFSWRGWASRRIAKIVFPYLILVTLSFVLYKISVLLFKALPGKQYDLFTLLAYLTFMRNFYEASFGFNPTLWYMPVILGLYVLFPILVRILEKYGPGILFAISTAATYGSIGLSFCLGYPVTHQSSIFPFYIILFAFGMLMGHSIKFLSGKFNELASAKMFFIGVVSYLISWAMVTFWTYGDAYNDIFTAIGIFFPTLYISKLLDRFSPIKSRKIFDELSRESYLMYLIHGAVILYVALPILMKFGKLPLNPIVSIIMALVYCGIVFLLARFISPAVNAIVNWALQSRWKRTA
jgi:peptidoglycan/LPS O-acetylase OafA/YrhL